MAKSVQLRSRPALTSVLVGALLLVLTSAAPAQDVIVEMPFDELPADAEIVADDIGLQGDTSVTGDLVVTGATGLGPAGLMFDDGSVQVSAAVGAPVGASANQGLYDNRIVEMVPALPFTEICIKNGGIEFDIHQGGQTTAGGFCLPGDLGWIIEREERTAAMWADARIACLTAGMRLPETFEFIVTCQGSPQNAVANITDNYEWTSNTVELVYNTGVYVAHAAATLGNGSCTLGGWGTVALTSDGPASFSYRCVR